ncbi:MAG: thioredoxin domain-containing protein [Deltaproteobacteria bacterium]|nr:thioredoxin domain-containing protein [Deltaproteobacteria bacterium]
MQRNEPVDLKLQQAIIHTLDRMAQGGIYDQIAGGFHRYSTDHEWLVPHFEKMLYNQALLGRVYAQSYFLTANNFHQQIARETFDYVLRDMKAPSGGFYSATDADSEGAEGTFFLWQQQQLKELLSVDDYQFVVALYDITASGNFEGRNILYLPEIPKIYRTGSAEFSDLKEWQDRLTRIKRRLYLAREKRIHPFKDKKIITAWNGMMITALAKAATFLNEPRYLSAAQQAADYLWKYHFEPRSGLSRISLGGNSSIQATQEDYAYFAEGLMALYDNSGEIIWLNKAQQLLDKMVEDFMDDTHGGFYLTSNKTKGPLISKIKSTHDGAIPSGNSVALSALVSIAGKTESLPNQQVLNKTLAFLSGKIKHQGVAHSYAMLAASESLNGEIGSKITLANGHIRASVVWLDHSSQHFAVTLTIDKGWHINADKIPQKDLFPTNLVLYGDDSNQSRIKVNYPSANSHSVSFFEQDLLLFSGTVVINGQLIKQQLLGEITQPLKLKLGLQACQDDRCLAPEERILILADEPLFNLML